MAADRGALDRRARHARPGAGPAAAPRRASPAATLASPRSSTAASAATPSTATPPARTCSPRSMRCSRSAASRDPRRQPLPRPAGLRVQAPRALLRPRPRDPGGARAPPRRRARRRRRRLRRRQVLAVQGRRRPAGRGGPPRPQPPVGHRHDHPGRYPLPTLTSALAGPLRASPRRRRARSSVGARRRAGPRRAQAARRGPRPPA
jgi:hypothetical protein